MSCGSCSACGSMCGGGCPACPYGIAEVTLTPDEIRLLTLFAEVPFLPAGKKTDRIIFREASFPDAETCIRSLSQKGILAEDFDSPIGGFDYQTYADCDVCGSIGLTAFGQSILDAPWFTASEES